MGFEGAGAPELSLRAFVTVLHPPRPVNQPPPSGRDSPPLAPDVLRAAALVRERPTVGFPAVVHPVWSERFPWLVQGTTTRRAGPDGPPFDLRTPGPGEESVAGAVPTSERWTALRRWAGARSLVRARQVHGSVVRTTAGGETSVPDCDGHLTTEIGVLLAVTVADCVPVFLVDPEARAVALLHAGWRGVAAGILEEGIDGLGGAGVAARLHLHLGPSICGACYEVGPEVWEALGLPRPPGPTPLDLRGVLVRRALEAGVAAARISRSEHCTRCGDGSFYSHRGGDAGRQAAFLGIREQR